MAKAKARRVSERDFILVACLSRVRLASDILRNVAGYAGGVSGIGKDEIADIIVKIEAIGDRLDKLVSPDD